ncbi:MAG TPA: NAD(P)H-hydrate dehydratase [Candidatus Nanoarchaeia archaeon]|nr:NAD(P)H-hydrate dehydratase [Candidatus Nanoarchaeia archaeon]
MKFLSKKDLIIPKRKQGSHKGDNGVVLAIGGSKEYPGAIALASLAALRSGCDIVRVAAPQKVAWAVNVLSSDIITIKLNGEYIGKNQVALLMPVLEKSDVLLLGNGMTISREGKAFCEKIVKNNKLKVIDADALKMLSLQDLKNSIVTPHLRELEALLRNSGISASAIKKIIEEKDTKKRAASVQKETKQWLEKNNIILLKGRIDSIISKNGIFFNKTGNAGMTRGGTGDVLAGLCAGFLAQSKDILQSAKNAEYINGQIGDILLKRKKGFTYLASDMVEEIKRISRR